MREPYSHQCPSTANLLRHQSIPAWSKSRDTANMFINFGNFVHELQIFSIYTFILFAKLSRFYIYSLPFRAYFPLHQVDTQSNKISLTYFPLEWVRKGIMQLRLPKIQTINLVGPVWLREQAVRYSLTKFIFYLVKILPT